MPFNDTCALMPTQSMSKKPVRASFIFFIVFVVDSLCMSKKGFQNPIQPAKLANYQRISKKS